MGFFDDIVKIVSKTATGAAKKTARVTVKVTRKPRRAVKGTAKATGIKPGRVIRRGSKPARDVGKAVGKTTAKIAVGGAKEVAGSVVGREVKGRVRDIQDIIRAFRTLGRTVNPKRNIEGAGKEFERINRENRRRNR